MFRFVSASLASCILVIFISNPMVAQAEAVVDFGFTGTIVVEQEAKSEGLETGYVYWFYDWFFDDRIPPTKLPPFQPPHGGNPGGSQPDEDLCDALQDDILSLNAKRMHDLMNLRQLHKSGEVTINGVTYGEGSREFQDQLEVLEQLLEASTEALSQAEHNIGDVCG